MELDELRRIDLAELHRDDASNVRTSYDAGELAELKAMVRRDGIMQNLGVKPREDGGYEVVWGFRRHRATEELLMDLAEEGTEEALALLAQRRKVPCMILTGRKLSDCERLQLIENLQRSGLDPVDEARGYAKALAMRDDDGKPVYESVEALAQAVGKDGVTKSYVARRMKLLQAPDFLLEAMREKVVLSVGIGEMIGAIPSIKDREQMARWAIKHPQLGVPMSWDQVREMIAAEFTKSLKGCGFDLKEHSLLTPNERVSLGFSGAVGEENDGSCEHCLFRTGKDPLLKGLLSTPGRGGNAGVDAWVCQAPRCFAMKDAAHHRVVASQAEANNMRVMEKHDAKKLFVSGVFESSEYVRRDQRPGYEFTGHYAEESLPPWEEILEGCPVSWIMCAMPGTKKGSLYLFESAKAIEMAEAKWQRDGKPNLFAKRPAKAAKLAKAKREMEAEEEEEEESYNEATTAKGEDATTFAAAHKDVWKERRDVMDRMYDLLLSAEQWSMEVWKEAALVAAAHASPVLLGAVLGLERNPKFEHSMKSDMVLAELRSRDMTVSEAQVHLLLALVADELIYKGTDGKLQALLCLESKVVRAKLGGARKSQLAEPLGTCEKVEEVPAAEDAAYHCDGCGLVCGVLAVDCPAVEKMAEGEFKCDLCDSKNGFEPLMGWRQEEYERWVPAGVNPGHVAGFSTRGAAGMSDEWLDLFETGAVLPESQFLNELLTLPVKLISSMTKAELEAAKKALKKPTEAQGKDAYNAWSKERMKITRALDKLKAQ